MKEKLRSMKKSNIIPKLNVTKIQVDIDNYKFVLYAIVVLEKIFSDLVNAETYQGKKLLTSEKNTISKNKVIPTHLEQVLQAFLLTFQRYSYLCC